MSERKWLPAFPVTLHNGRVETSGMQLRDYFAAQALAGHLAAQKVYYAEEYHDLAERCYRLADEMMKAREQ